jgi:hypothetical protein
MEEIEPGFDVFVHDGEKAFGAVRQVLAHGAIVIYVEGGGDFVVPLTAIKDTHSEKVILDGAKIDAKLKTAIAHAHGREDPTI